MNRYDPQSNIESRYRILYDKKLGEGGFGKVYRGLHLLTKESVAVKEIDKGKPNVSL